MQRIINSQLQSGHRRPNCSTETKPLRSPHRVPCPVCPVLLVVSCRVLGCGVSQGRHICKMTTQVSLGELHKNRNLADYSERMCRTLTLSTHTSINPTFKDGKSVQDFHFHHVFRKIHYSRRMSLFAAFWALPMLNQMWQRVLNPLFSKKNHQCKFGEDGNMAMPQILRGNK